MSLALQSNLSIFETAGLLSNKRNVLIIDYISRVPNYPEVYADLVDTAKFITAVELGADPDELPKLTTNYIYSVISINNIPTLINYNILEKDEVNGYIYPGYEFEAISWALDTLLNVMTEGEGLGKAD